MVRITAFAAVCALALAAAGCKPLGIDAVRPGMMPFDVEEVMGREPVRVIRGKGVDLDKETHVYPTGRVHFFKKRVVYVEKEKQAPTITEGADRLRDEEHQR